MSLHLYDDNKAFLRSIKPHIDWARSGYLDGWKARGRRVLNRVIAERGMAD
jgi:hypothetical protein